jgi:hypothetical protein
MSGLDSGARAGFKEALNALMPEASDHLEIVACGATHCKRYNSFLDVRIPDRWHSPNF